MDIAGFLWSVDCGFHVRNTNLDVGNRELVDVIAWSADLQMDREASFARWLILKVESMAWKAVHLQPLKVVHLDMKVESYRISS